MRIIWIFILFEIATIASAFDEYLTIWAPKKVYDTKYYNVVVLPSNVNKETEISLKFRKSFFTTVLRPERPQKLAVENPHRSGLNNEFEVIMTLHRNESTSTGYIQQMCITEALQTIETEKKHFYTFIQTDKSIYKSGDTVKFRVVVVDRDLKPYHMNNIDIKVSNPSNQNKFQFEDLDGSSDEGVTDYFTLPSNSLIGTWKINVIVDKQEEFKAVKEFSVQEFTLPRFTAHIEANNNHLLINDTLHLSFYAKYTSGDYVKGNAEMRIKSINNGQIVATRSFRDISDVKKVQVRDSLRITTTTTKQDYEAELVFTEPESGVNDKIAVTFTIHADSSPKIQANHPEKFMPGLPFSLKVFVFNWKDKMIKSSQDSVEIKFECRLNNATEQTLVTNIKIKDGVVKYNFEVPEDVDELIVKINYQNATYERVFQKGLVFIGVSKLIVEHEPKNPKYGEDVDIYITADSEVDELIGIVTSRNGIIRSHRIRCYFRFSCKFTITMLREMIPVTNVAVYHLKDKFRITKGETIIKIDDLGSNMLNIELPESAENEITKEDVIKELGDFDASNQVYVFEIEKRNWHECTEMELEQIEKGREFF